MLVPARLARIATALIPSFALLLASCGGSPEPASTDTSTSSPAPAAAPAPVAQKTDGPDKSVTGGPGRAQPDLFHPNNQPDGAGERPPMPAPKKGGRAIVHLASMPRHVNYMTENSAVTHWILQEAHEFLVKRDWNSWEHKPVLASRWESEDTLILKGGRGENNANVLYGEVTEDGDDWVVKPLSHDNPTTGEKRIPKSEAESVQHGTVFTFDLRNDVYWHDGHKFDAHDVYFSWQSYWNKTVDCDDVRHVMAKLIHAEVLNDHSIRFFYENQYFAAVDAFTGLTILPSHRYNLSDKENPDYDSESEVLGAKQGKYINDHPLNINWIGLGPYQITEVNEQFIDAKRFEKYFDPQHGGYLDEIRWRHIPNDDAAKVALLNGELDYWSRLRSEDYFGEFTQKTEFTDSYYKGYTYLPRMQYMAWNMRRPKFAQREVRQALAHAFDWDEYLRTQANGLGVRISYTQFYLSPVYDHSVKLIDFDLEKAQELLTDAGWYDRDGDGIIDKDGIAFEFEYLMTPGNKASSTMALKLQENLAQLGIKLSIGTRDWAAFIERVRNKDFDAFGMAWVLDVEGDPEQLWHSWQGDPGEDRSSNYPGVADAKVDELIGEIQVELDNEKRAKLHHKLHRRLYELQPYMFTYMVPIKFAMSKRFRNFWGYGINPGYSLREWYEVDETSAEPVAVSEN